MEFLLVLLLGTLAVGAVLYPVFRRTPAAGRFPGTATASRGARGAPLQNRPPPLDDDALDAEVARYREAIRAGSLCPRCSEANPRSSRFCAECGGRL